MSSVYFTKDDMCTTQKLEMKRVQDFFQQNGWEISEDIKTSDLILCLTCVGWDRLEQRSVKRLQGLKKYEDRVVSIGCLNDFKPEIVSQLHSGKCVPSRNLKLIEELIPNAKIKLEDIPEPSTFRTKEDYRLYDLTKRFVNIAYGCSFSCSYCPHKIGLGPLRSRSIDNIISQVRQLKNEGVRIVVLTGMETALYGKDIGVTYPQMLKEVMSIDNDFEIHVAQFNPIGITKYGDELIGLFSNNRITDIQIPIQTTSDRLLRMMKRPTNVTVVREFLRKVREKNKIAVCRTDIIIGFPTETEEELENTLEFVSEVFDEVAAYACELRETLDAGKLIDKAFDNFEMERRVRYAVEFLESKNVMTHSGEQSKISMKEIEKRKEEVRRRKRETD